MNPNAGNSSFGIGGFNPQVTPANPQSLSQYTGQMQQREPQMPGSTMLFPRLPEFDPIDDRSDAQKNEAVRFAESNPVVRSLAGGGIASLGSYSDGGRMLKGPGDGMSDNIPATIGGKQPARLADGEFVVPADVVSHLGNGSTDAGAKQLYAMMNKVRKARTGRKAQGREISPHRYMPA